MNQTAADAQIAHSKTDQAGEGKTLFLGEKTADRVTKWLDAAPANAPLFRNIRKNGCVRHCGLAKNTVYKIVRKRGGGGSRRDFWTQRTFGAGGHGAVPHRLRRQHQRGCRRGTLEVSSAGHPLRQPPRGGAKRRRQISSKPRITRQRSRGVLGRQRPPPLFPEPK